MKLSLIMVLVTVFSVGLPVSCEVTPRTFTAKKEVPLTEEEQKALLVQYDRITGILGLERKKEGLSFCRRTIFEAMGKSLQIDDGKISICMYPKTGEIAEILETDRSDWLKWQNTTPEIVPPTRKRDEVIELARKYVHLILEKPFPENFVLSKVRYYEKGHGKGEWDVIWRRTLNGYEYQNDDITVVIADPWGKLRYFLNKTASEECQTETRIPREQAEKIAIAKASDFAGRFNTEAFGKPKNPIVGSVKLMIVNPNGFFKGKLDYYSTPKCRLAYVIQVNFEVEPPRETVKVVVYVDAITGAILGGDANL